ncbi:hypothetical protein [Lichenicoccus sp.]|uniref:hypothetical protein n=1 Tax=Lichenicoccus sp. TaxID=2781899 RepID=UPI003D0F04BA
MGHEHAVGARGAAAHAPRTVALALALLPVAACSAPPAPPHTDPFYLAPAVPRDNTASPPTNPGGHGGGGAHGGGGLGAGAAGIGAGGQYPGLDAPEDGAPAASGSMSMGSGRGL